MIIWSSINCPTVICSPTVCYFSREKTLVKRTAPGCSSSYICLAIYFSFAFLFRSIKPKIQIYFAALYFICDLLFQSTRIYLTSACQFLAPLPGRIDNPFNTSGCEVLLFVCRCCLCCVAWFSYWFDNLGFFTEGNTNVAVLHHPFLFWEIPT